MKTNQIISIIICLILFRVEYREINDNLHDITNSGYVYLLLAVTIRLYRNWLKNKKSGFIVIERYYHKKYFMINYYENILKLINLLDSIIYGRFLFRYVNVRCMGCSIN